MGLTKRPHTHNVSVVPLGGLFVTQDTNTSRATSQLSTVVNKLSSPNLPSGKKSVKISDFEELPLAKTVEPDVRSIDDQVDLLENLGESREELKSFEGEEPSHVVPTLAATTMTSTLAMGSSIVRRPPEKPSHSEKLLPEQGPEGCSTRKASPNDTHIEPVVVVSVSAEAPATRPAVRPRKSPSPPVVSPAVPSSPPPAPESESHPPLLVSDERKSTFSQAPPHQLEAEQPHIKITRPGRVLSPTPGGAKMTRNGKDLRRILSAKKVTTRHGNVAEQPDEKPHRGRPRAESCADECMEKTAEGAPMSGLKQMKRSSSTIVPPEQKEKKLLQVAGGETQRKKSSDEDQRSKAEDSVEEPKKRKRRKGKGPRKPKYVIASTRKSSGKKDNTERTWRSSLRREKLVRQGSMLSQRLLSALQSTNYAQEPVPIQINTEYYNRVKRREVLKQIQHNFRYETDRSFDPDPFSCFVSANKYSDISRALQYAQLAPSTWQGPYIYRVIYLMLRQMEIPERQEDRAAIARLRESDVRLAIEDSFEGAKQYFDMKAKVLSQSFEEGERKMMTDNVRPKWYEDAAATADEKPALSMAIRYLVYEEKKYSWKKLVKTDIEMFDKSNSLLAGGRDGPKPKRRISGKHFVVPLPVQIKQQDVENPTVSTSMMEEELDFTRSNRSISVSPKFNRQELAEFAKQIKDLIGDAVKSCNSEGNQKRLVESHKKPEFERFREKLLPVFRKDLRFGSKQIAFNIKEAGLDIVAPDNESADAQSQNKRADAGETLRKLMARRMSQVGQPFKQEELTPPPQAFGVFFPVDDPKVDITPESDEKRCELLHHVNADFRKELLSRIDSFEIYTECTEYNKEVGEMVTRWRSLQQAISALEEDQFKPENRAFIVDGERIAVPFIFEGSERLDGNNLADRWLPQHRLSDENMSIDSISDYSDSIYIPLRRENDIAKKESKMPDPFPLEEKEDEDRSIPLVLRDPFDVTKYKNKISAVRERYKGQQTLEPQGLLPLNDDEDVPMLRRCPQYSSKNVLVGLTPMVHEAMLNEESKLDQEISDADFFKLQNVPMDSPAICISPIRKDSRGDLDQPTPVMDALLCLATPTDSEAQQPKKRATGDAPRNRLMPRLSELRLELKSLASAQIPDAKKNGGRLLQGKPHGPELAKLIRRQSEKRLSIKEPAVQEEVAKEALRRRVVQKNTSILLSPINEDDSATNRNRKSQFRRRRLFNIASTLRPKINDPAQLLYQAIRRTQVNDVLFVCAHSPDRSRPSFPPIRA